MICRTCLRQAPRLPQRAASAAAAASAVLPLARRSFTTTLRARNAAASPAAPTETDAPSLADGEKAAAAADDGDAQLSSCPKGTILTGLNYFKNKTDPVAMADKDYPAWLWTCLDFKNKSDADADDGEIGDAFSKSKKQRRLAAKRQKQIEARIAAGDLSSLIPKVPLHHQSINLPGGEDGSVESALLAAEKREELRGSMRKDRKAKIKESNYLKTM